MDDDEPHAPNARPGFFNDMDSARPRQAARGSRLRPSALCSALSLSLWCLLSSSSSSCSVSSSCSFLLLQQQQRQRQQQQLTMARRSAGGRQRDVPRRGRIAHGDVVRGPRNPPHTAAALPASLGGLSPSSVVCCRLTSSIVGPCRCVLAAPLIVGCDMTTMSRAENPRPAVDDCSLLPCLLLESSQQN